MERVDIVVTGLDPARPRAEVIAALAQRLTRSAEEITLLLEVAPSPLVRAISETDAEPMLAELRALGARVKVRAEARESAAPSESAPAPTDDEIVPLPNKHDRNRRDEDAPESEPDRDEPAPDPTSPAVPLIVRSSHEWFQPTSSSPPPPLSAPAPPLAASAAARSGRASTDPRTPRAKSRVFFRDLPDALVLPLRLSVLRAHALAAILAVVALVCAGLGLRSEMSAGALLLALSVAATIGYVSLVHQLAAACHAAAIASDATPAPLPGRLMEDYLAPGAYATAALAVLGALAIRGAIELAAMRATTLTMTLFWGAITIYGTLGFTLAAAGRSAFGYLDVARMLRIATAAPLALGVVLALGGVPLAIAVGSMGWALTAALEAPSLSTFVVDVALLGPLAAVAGSYAASVVGGAMGILISSARIGE